MRIGTPTVDVGTSIAEIVKSQANVDLLDHEAVKFVHGDIEGDVYLENLKAWAKNSKEEIVERGSEIPEGLPQGDLYRWLFSLMKIGTNLKCVASMSRIYQRDSRRSRDSMRSRR
jgi:hypothetical protein